MVSKGKKKKKDDPAGHNALTGGKGVKRKKKGKLDSLPGQGRKEKEKGPSRQKGTREKKKGPTALGPGMRLDCSQDKRGGRMSSSPPRGGREKKKGNL